MDMVWMLALAALLGWAVGYFCRPKARHIGALRVDHSDPEGPYFFMVLTERPENVMKESRVMLDVQVENYLPRK